MLAESVFPGGCYRIRAHMTDDGRDLEGTLRVDRSTSGNQLLVSGDLYAWPSRSEQIGGALTAPGGGSDHLEIPIYPRAFYQSYLHIRSVAPGCDGGLILTADEFLYASPEHPHQRGVFPALPSRALTLDLARAHRSLGLRAETARYQGRVLVDDRYAGVVSLDWVSPYLRRAELHVHVAAGAVPPVPVQDSELQEAYFDTVFAASGWQLSVLNGGTGIQPPPGLSASGRWSRADLFKLLESVRDPLSNQDRQWRIDLLIVTEGMESALGVMFDDVGREAAASFSSGRYSNIDSSSYGCAAGMRQSDVPRAHLRSALHEVTHAFNQVDQHRRAADDNSIMTTTPRLAEFLANLSDGFPDEVGLRHNAAVRYYLNHLPDPVVRPGGWPFQAWCWGDVPGRAPRVVEIGQLV